MSLALVTPSRHNPRHHFFLGNQVVDALQVVQQALHVTAPLVQHVISVARLREADQPSGTVNLGVNCLRCHQVTDVLLGLLLGQIQEFRQTAHLNPCVILGHYPHVVFNDTLSEVLPSLIRLVIGGRAGLGIKNVCVAQVRTELLRDHRPAHQLGDGKKVHQTGFNGNVGDTAVLLNTVQQV